MARITGYLTSIEGCVAKGWAIDLDDVDRDLVVELVDRDEVLVRAWADLSRPQVQMRYGGTGLCGFRLESPSERDPAGLIVRERDSGHVLKRSKSFSIAAAAPTKADSVGASTAGAESVLDLLATPTVASSDPDPAPTEAVIRARKRKSRGGGRTVRPVPFSLLTEQPEGTEPFFVVFVLGARQDVDVVSVYDDLVADGMDVKMGLLVRDDVAARDHGTDWRGEVRTLADEEQADLTLFETAQTAFDYLEGKHGILVAGTDSGSRAVTGMQDWLEFEAAARAPARTAATAAPPA